MSTQRIALHVEEPGKLAQEARRRLAEQLGGGWVTEPDETGTFEAAIEADSREAAFGILRDAIAGAGADDHVVVLYHP
jgi:hypothetical protein